MKKCGQCGEWKPFKNFAWANKAEAIRESMCRQCRKAYDKYHNVFGTTVKDKEKTVWKI